MLLKIYLIYIFLHVYFLCAFLTWKKYICKIYVKVYKIYFFLKVVYSKYICQNISGIYLTYT